MRQFAPELVVDGGFVLEYDFLGEQCLLFCKPRDGERREGLLVLADRSLLMVLLMLTNDSFQASY